MLCMMFAVSGCRPQAGITLHSAAVVHVAREEGVLTDSEQVALPESVVLALDVENGGAGILLREGRLRVSYRGRRVAMFSLTEKVRIKRRSREVISLPLKVNVARNSQSVALLQALYRHDAEHIALDWELTARAGVVGVQISRPPMPLSEVVQGEKLEYLWLEFDKMFGVEELENF